MANAVNLTDGLDTLAGGTSAIAFASYGVIAFLQKQEPWCLFASPLPGAVSFPLVQCPPRNGLYGRRRLAYARRLARCVRPHDRPVALSALIGMVFVAETLSDILQVLYFKLTRGKRLFRMAPIHHHFEDYRLVRDADNHALLDGQHGRGYAGCGAGASSIHLVQDK